MAPADKCPECGEKLVQIAEGVFTMYVCDVLYCDNCDKSFNLDDEFQPPEFWRSRRLAGL